MAKELLWRIEFEGADAQVKKLEEIQQALKDLTKETIEQNKEVSLALGKQKIDQQALLAEYKKEQQAIRDKAKENKAVAGSLEQLRLEAKRLGKQLETTWEVGSKEFKKAAQELETVNRKIRNADKSAGNFKSNIGNYAGSIGDAFQGVGLNVGKLTGSLGAMSMAGGPVGVMLGALVGGAQLFGKAIQTTDTLSDKFSETLGSAKAATTVFFTALATGNWDNFLDRIRGAVEWGAQYEKLLDRLADKQRAFELNESDAVQRQAQLRIDLRNQMLTEDERIKKGLEFIEIEDKLTNKRTELAKEKLAADLNDLAVTKGINKERAVDMIKNIENYNSLIKIVEQQDYLQKQVDQTADSKQKFGLQIQLDKLKITTAGYYDAIKAFSNLSDENKNLIKDDMKAVTDRTTDALNNTGRVQARVSALLKSVADETVTSYKTQQKAVSDLHKEMLDLDRQFLQFIKTSETFNKLYGSNLFNKAQSLTTKTGFSGQLTDGTGSVGGERTGAGTANLPPAPTSGEQAGAVIGAYGDYAAQSTMQFVDLWVSAYAQQTEAREASLKRQLDLGLITEKKYQKEVNKIRNEQARKEKTAALINAIINTALGVTKAMSEMGIVGAVIAGVLGAASIAMIASQPTPQYAKGGMIDVGGNSHAAGGTKFVGSDGSRFEAERGEVITIVNKRDSARLRALSDLNSEHGRPFYSTPSGNYFATGGMFQPNQNIGATDASRMVRQIVSEVSAIPVTVSLNEIKAKDKLSRKAEVIGAL